MPSPARETALAAIALECPATAVSPEDFPRGSNATELFGRDVFSLRVMRERLPQAVYERLEKTINRHETLNAADADVIAGAMKDWALERGATHYTHWFQPMTGLTAEKHDAFLSPTPDGQVISEFAGKMLIRGESDASSFPSGGLRSTFEARGYTAWDPTSPVFLMGDPGGRTLYIPTVFFAYTGESLDRKTPLMRSEDAVSRQALRILRLLGNTTATGVRAMVGAEQEYFLVDSRLFVQRPDLMLCGRTLYGAKPSKGQEMEDHYFGSIPSRVMAFMQDVEQRLFALGIPAHTRHNEVAPGQFEVAPTYEDVNIATDHNMLIMEVMRRTAAEHGFACLLHEKPFAGVNGSGKHNNWSLCDSEGCNLLNPGDTPMHNARFLLFLAGVLRAVHKYAVNLRLGIIGAGNDHRLGANEAPPAVLSVYLGESLTSVVRALASHNDKAGGGTVVPLEIGVSALPPLPRDFSDRNRTSPFAFTGNKFEFRALGSSQNIATANISLNAAVACALDDIATELEKAVTEGVPLNTAIQNVLTELFSEHLPVIFDGNNYAPEWLEEAARRGLPNLPDTVSALAHYDDPDVMTVFSRHHILGDREMLSRREILLDNYSRAIAIEAQLTLKLGRTRLLPAVLDWQSALAATVERVAAVAGEAEAEKRYFLNVRAHGTAFLEALEALERCIEENRIADAMARACYARDHLLPAMNACRAEADILEGLCPDGDWPLPTYAELLWLH